VKHGKQEEDGEKGLMRSLIIRTFTRNYYGDEIKEDEMSKICNMNGI
jgi:hypothetical protein